LRFNFLVNHHNFQSMYRKVFSLLLFAFIIWPTISNAQNTPKYPSLLWKITGNGLSKPSYLYGTMHVSSKIAFHLGDSFFIALKGADAIALESDPSLWLAEMLHTDEEHELSHDIYQRNNAYNFYKNAFYLPTINNKMISASLARNPELLNGMMYRYSGYGQEFEEETYLDLFIYQSGHRLKKQVIGLEDFSEVDSLLKLAMQKMGDEDEDEDEKNRVALKKIRKEGKNASEMLEDAYRRGDLDLLDSVQKLMNGSANYQRYMLEERNKIMARNMDSIMKMKTLFTGIGAAHLAGEQGVIELLRRRGFTLTPVLQQYGKLSKKSKEKIEGLSVSRTFTTQKSTDGFFEVDIPGTLYEFPEEYFIKEYFYPDLANGAFYSVRRVRTYGPLIHYTAAMMQAKTDSLLFENIPGKLISKKQYVLNGYNTIEILSKLKRGDYQRYVLVFTPMEIIIFRAGGRKEYVKKGEASKFFKSIKLNAPNGDWKEYSSYNKDLTITMPAGSFHDETDLRMKRIFSPNKSFQGVEASTGDYFMLKRVSLHDVDYIEEDTFEFNQLEKNFFEKYTFDIIVSQQVGQTAQGFPNYKVHRQFEQKDIFVNWIVNGPFYYVLVAQTSDSIKAHNYFKSLQLKFAANYKSFTTEIDTQYYYSVNTNVKVNKPQRYNYYYNGSSSKKTNNDHLEVNRSKQYNYSSTDEEVYMHYRKTHKYDYYENPDSLWLKLKKEENNGNSMHWGDVKFKEKDSVFTWELILTDTGSSRGIYTKYLVKNRVIYSLKSCIDTSTGPSKFVSEFYKTFWPTDTIIGLSLFVNKADMFFEELWGNDSLAKEQALKSINKIQFENKHIPDLIKTIQHFTHKDYSTDDKAKLVYKLGKLKGPEILPFYKKYYMAMVDTPLVQVNILQALGRQKSITAINLFMELIVAETPLLYSNYEMAHIFWALNDSLPIAKKTFPMIMEFTQYPEYKSYVYRFVGELLDSGELKTSDLAKFKASIIKETKNDIKRQQASDQETDKYSYGYYNISTNSDLMSLVKLITPYSKEVEVKKIFEKLKKLDNDGIRFALGLHMLKNDLPADDTLWNYLAQKENYRLLVYKALKEISCLNKLSDTLITQENMAKATIYKNQKASDRDTIEFLARKEATINGQTGYIYFFKRKKNYGTNNWFVDYSGPHPLDTATFNQIPLFANKGTDLDMYDDINEQLEKILVAMKNKQRRRYSDSSSNGEYNYYDYEEDAIEMDYDE
jgi:uncharacterized protein YbaP (TraB family)